jgi:hypothetical protein
VIPQPLLLVSSVVRGSRQGDSHGGLYLVDFKSGGFEQVLDWNTCDIDFEGRGADRGLRGIVIRDDAIFVAASDELFAFDRQFKIIASYRNPYLKHCHEICEYRGRLYLTSTGFDSILQFDLARRAFDVGVRFMREGDGLAVKPFDAASPGGPAASMAFHINSVYVDETGAYVAGVRLPALVRLSQNVISIAAILPPGTHNARPFRGGVLFNDTERDSVVWQTPARRISIPVPRYPEADLQCMDFDRSGIARQAFGRGLRPVTDTIVVGGSSPTTVSLYDLSTEQRLESINLTMDVRNAAHGVAILPD